jgi:hypothetical protein
MEELILLSFIFLKRIRYKKLILRTLIRKAGKRFTVFLTSKGAILLPFQGVVFLVTVICRVAAGYHLLPLRGYGKGSLTNSQALSTEST